MQPQVRWGGGVASGGPLVEFGQGKRDVMARIGAGGQCSAEQNLIALDRYRAFHSRKPSGARDHHQLLVGRSIGQADQAGVQEGEMTQEAVGLVLHRERGRRREGELAKAAQVREGIRDLPGIGDAGDGLGEGVRVNK